MEIPDIKNDFDTKEPPVELTKEKELSSKNLEAEQLLSGDGFAITARWYYNEAESANNMVMPLFLTYFPCELIAISWRYRVAASAADTGFTVVRTGSDSSSGTIVGGAAATICSTSATAEIVYSKNKKQHFNTTYSFLRQGDAIKIEQFGTLTGIRDLVITLHFKYSGRGEQRLN